MAKVRSTSSETESRPADEPWRKQRLCPACGKDIARRAKICVGCGLNLETGRKLTTSQALDENVLYVRAENWIRMISWLVPIGIYPIASEAFGTRKPYVARLIAIAMVLCGVAYLMQSITGDPGVRRYELWPKKPTPEQISIAYARRTPTASGLRLNLSGGQLGIVADIPDSAISEFEHQRRTLRSTYKEDEVASAAYDALPEHWQAFGRFRWYQLWTHPFVHAGLLHLAGNLLFLLIFGTRINAILGQFGMLLSCAILSAAGGGLYLLAASDGPSMPFVGASGLITGLAGMYLILFPGNLVHNAAWCRAGFSLGAELYLKLFAVRGVWIILLYVALDVILTRIFSENPYALWTHLGGFAAGVLLALSILALTAALVKIGDRSRS